MQSVTFVSAKITQCPNTWMLRSRDAKALRPEKRKRFTKIVISKAYILNDLFQQSPSSRIQNLVKERSSSCHGVHSAIGWSATETWAVCLMGDRYRSYPILDTSLSTYSTFKKHHEALLEVFQDNLVLSTGLIMWIGHRRELDSKADVLSVSDNFTCKI